MRPLALWLATLILIAACAQKPIPRAESVRSKVTVHEPTKRVPYRWESERLMDARHAHYPDLITDDGTRVPGPPLEYPAPEIILNGQPLVAQ